MTCQPAVVAIDGPRFCAPEGHSAREGELQLARQVCGIRWTPDIRHVRANLYYAWILEGLALFGTLEGCGAEVIEVFPTASWTRWHGQRGLRTRGLEPAGPGGPSPRWRPGPDKPGPARRSCRGVDGPPAHSGYDRDHRRHRGSAAGQYATDRDQVTGILSRPFGSFARPAAAVRVTSSQRSGRPSAVQQEAHHRSRRQRGLTSREGRSHDQAPLDRTAWKEAQWRGGGSGCRELRVTATGDHLVPRGRQARRIR
jgi:hypothetical protein